jgi:hypothetical protein
MRIRLIRSGGGGGMDEDGLWKAEKLVRIKLNNKPDTAFVKMV